MKAITTAGDMLKTMACVRHFVPRKSALPILCHVKIVASNGTVRIEGGEFGTWSRADVAAANARSDGTCIVHGENLYALLSKMPKAAPITIASVNGTFQILGQNREVSLPTEDLERHPTLDGQGTHLAALLPLDTLRDALRETLPCVAPDDETRCVLTYVRFHLQGQTLIVEASDGRRAAIYRTDIRYNCTDFTLLLLGNALRKFLAATRLIPGKALVSISTGGGLTLGVSGIAVTTRPFENGTTSGKFPNIQAILPKRFARSVTVDRAELRSAFEEASLVALNDEHLPGVIEMTLTKRTLWVRAQSKVGSCNIGVPLRAPGGHVAIRLRCNSKYMLPFLRARKGGDIRIRFQAGSCSMFLIEPSGADVTCFQMPVRFKDPVVQPVERGEVA